MIVTKQKFLDVFYHCNFWKNEACSYFSSSRWNKTFSATFRSTYFTTRTTILKKKCGNGNRDRVTSRPYIFLQIDLFTFYDIKYCALQKNIAFIYILFVVERARMALDIEKRRKSSLAWWCEFRSEPVAARLHGA